jgi:hypothetical protein
MFQNLTDTQRIWAFLIGMLALAVLLAWAKPR